MTLLVYKPGRVFGFTFIDLLFVIANIAVLGSPLTFGAASQLESDRADLSGVVRAKDGSPLADASIFIYTAAPRTGPGLLCPFEYADCRKNGDTDAQGRFKLESLDPTLLFRILAVGKDHIPKFISEVDPFQGQVEVSLEELSKGILGPKNQLRGRVVDPTGNPIPNAAVSFEFFYGDEANCGGNCDGVDLLAVTDEDGGFIITTRKRFDWMTVAVEARSYAKRKFSKLSSETVHDLTLTEGSTVLGRVLKDGSPLANISIGLVSVDLGENYTGDFKRATNQDGQFVFRNIPPNQDFYVYGHMDSLRPAGALPVKKIHVQSDETVLNVGELIPRRGLRIEGRVSLSDGGSIPSGAKLTLGRIDARDSSVVDINPAGEFVVTGVPRGSVSLHVRIPGYRFSESNRTLDRLNGGNLVGYIANDISGLMILLEPGQFVRPSRIERRNFVIHPRPVDEPLRGAEALTSEIK